MWTPNRVRRRHMTQATKGRKGVRRASVAVLAAVFLPLLVVGPAPAGSDATPVPDLSGPPDYLIPPVEPVGDPAGSGGSLGNADLRVHGRHSRLQRAVRGVERWLRQLLARGSVKPRTGALPDRRRSCPSSAPAWPSGLRGRTARRSTSCSTTWGRLRPRASRSTGRSTPFWSEASGSRTCSPPRASPRLRRPRVASPAVSSIRGVRLSGRIGAS